MSTPPTALVTGASGGIGRLTARRFVEEGHRVALGDLAQDSVKSLADELKKEFPDADLLPLVLDQSSEESIKQGVEQIREWAGELNVLALVAGTVQVEGRAVLDLEVDEWDRVHNTNLRGVFLTCKHFLKIIPEGGAGSIVAVASFWGRMGHPLYSSYCTSKAGVISFVQCLAAELADKAIRVNAVAPGNIDTGMHRKALEDEATARGITFKEMRDIEWNKIPMKKAGDPRSISDAIHFLSTDRASYITGATLDVNGGVIMI